MDTNIATKLMKLVEMQEIDTRLDDIVKLRGSLPQEVDRLAQKIEEIYTKITDNEGLLASLQEEVVQKKAFVKHTEKKIQQYEAQQMEVRNNREYDAIIKELDLHQLDIQLAEKFLRTAYKNIEETTADLEALKKHLKTEEGNLLAKKQELTSILQTSEAEEVVLNQKHTALIIELGEPLYGTYSRIRESAPHHLAVVSIRNGACGGCNIVIPPQQKLEIYERNKIVRCEVCTRMLIAIEKLTDPLLYAS